MLYVKGMKVMQDKNFEEDLMDELNTVASYTECTGLIQIPPTDSEQADAYGKIYVIPNQVNDFEKVKKPKGRCKKSAPNKSEK